MLQVGRQVAHWPRMRITPTESTISPGPFRVAVVLICAAMLLAGASWNHVPTHSEPIGSMEDSSMVGDLQKEHPHPACAQLWGHVMPRCLYPLGAMPCNPWGQWIGTSMRVLMICSGRSHLQAQLPPETKWVLKANIHRGKGVSVLPQQEAVSRALERAEGTDGYRHVLVQSYLHPQVRVATLAASLVALWGPCTQ